MHSGQRKPSKSLKIDKRRAPASKEPSSSAQRIHDTETSRFHDSTQTTRPYSERDLTGHLPVIRTSDDAVIDAPSSYPLHEYPAGQPITSTHSSSVYQLPDNIAQIEGVSSQQGQDLQHPGTNNHNNEHRLTDQQEDIQFANTTSSVSSAHAYYEDYQYQLQLWAHETSHPNLNTGEILYEKSNWEDPQDGYEHQNRNLAVTQQFDGPPWDLGENRQRL